ncbi:MAG: S9 family peptidase [Ignavibacteriales bacterium]|nr:S9 family peptidase [Ignavibacteriales bacterium]
MRNKATLFFSFIIMIVIGILQCTLLIAQTTRPLEIEDLFRIKRVADPQISPDGKWIAFVITDVDKVANKMNSDIWLMPISGGEMRRLTSSPGSDANPRWSPNSKTIAFVSSRSGDGQIWLIDVDGGEARQFTTLSPGASNPVWSPDGKTIAFVSTVYPEFSDKPFEESDDLNRKKDESKAKSKIKARIMTKLLYKHWNAWVDDKRQHIFVQGIEGGEPKDITPGDRDAVPTSSTFSAGDDFAFSPDGKEIAYTATPTENEAWNTNHDIYTVSIDGSARKQVTSNPAADGFPKYSKDGKYIAYRAQRTPGFEADKFELMLYNRITGSIERLSEKFDVSVGAFQWTTDGNRIYFTSEEKANQQIYYLSLKDRNIIKVVEGGVNGEVSISTDGKSICFSRHTFSRPAEIFRASSDGKNIQKLTSVNDKLFSNIEMNEPESITYKGADGATIQAWLLKPSNFDATKKYPLVLLVHGGPQGAWENGWHYRWNAQMWAAQGYVILAPNPRGSTGFGQQFVNEISGDWGGKVYEDVMGGVDHVEKLPYIDNERIAAAGASYGGYFMNWLATQSGKFKTIITHASIYNFYSMYGTTEEVWFDEWEHGGTPWDVPEEYNKFSPHAHAKNLLKYKTPMLIIHNELDYRVPVSEGMQLFTTLQRMGIKSKFLYFPDEGHGVLKPQNSELWHKTVFEWLAEHLK